MTPRARLDDDRKARPLTVLLGHTTRSSSGEGTCWVNGASWILNTETDEMTYLGRDDDSVFGLFAEKS